MVHYNERFDNKQLLLRVNRVCRRWWRVETSGVSSADVLWNIDKLTVANVVIDVFILVAVILQTFFIGQYVSHISCNYQYTVEQMEQLIYRTFLGHFSKWHKYECTIVAHLWASLGKLFKESF